jgi:hypothetical protein
MDAKIEPGNYVKGMFNVGEMMQRDAIALIE